MKNPKAQQSEGSWKEFKGRLQEAWGVLTDDEIDEYEGKREQLEGHIQQKTGETREHIRDQIDQMAKELNHRI